MFREGQADFPAGTRSTGRKGGLRDFLDPVNFGWEERQEKASLGNGMGKGIEVGIKHRCWRACLGAQPHEPGWWGESGAFCSLCPTVLSLRGRALKEGDVSCRGITGGNNFVWGDPSLAS